MKENKGLKQFIKDAMKVEALVARGKIFGAEEKLKLGDQGTDTEITGSTFSERKDSLRKIITNQKKKTGK